MKYAARAAQKETITFIEQKSKEFIKETTKVATETLQSELLGLLKQLDDLNGVIEQKDKENEKACKKLQHTERKIAEYAALFNAKHVKMDLAKDEINRLSCPEDDDLMAPL